MLYLKAKRFDLRATKEFKDTNKIWNDLRLNSRANIGCLMYLIKESNATSFEEWEEYYFKSGEIRKSKSFNLNDYDERRKYNSEYGRTKDELLNVAKKLKPYCNNSLELAYNFVYIRVIDETWLGYQRELIAFSKIDKFLKSRYSSITIKPVSYETDIKYAVDFEIYYKEELILAIQLKSDRYFNSNRDAVLDIKNVNSEKNKEYKKKFRVDVFYIYINRNYYLINLDDFKSYLKDILIKNNKK